MNKVECPKCHHKFVPKGFETDEIKKALEKSIRAEYKLELKNQKEQMEREHEEEIDELNEQIENLKEDLERERDYKSRLSTKGIGEEFEQYCYNEFQKHRAKAYPFAMFEKDNEAIGSRNKTKGDFIFRNYNSNEIDKIETVSIMFEMKNEATKTKTKQKNEQFFEKLHNDRIKKNCEYAVLVSTLEKDNDFYNGGIADVSYAYPKMFVVRPQCFMTIIDIINSCASNNLNTLKELELYKKQNYNMQILKNNIEVFRDSFQEKVANANNNYKEVIDDIQNVIDTLTEAKIKLENVGTNLTQANNLLVDLSFGNVTKGITDTKK